MKARQKIEDENPANIRANLAKWEDDLRKATDSYKTWASQLPPVEIKTVDVQASVVDARSVAMKKLFGMEVICRKRTACSWQPSEIRREQVEDRYPKNSRPAVSEMDSPWFGQFWCGETGHSSRARPAPQCDFPHASRRKRRPGRAHPAPRNAVGRWEALRHAARTCGLRSCS